MLCGALALFLVGLQLIQAGVSGFTLGLGPFLIHQNPVHTLGLAWLASYLLLGGSQVAEATLSLLDSGALSKLQTFSMIVGTRFGAAFVVLLLGLIYCVQGKHLKQSLAAGILAYLTSFWLALGSLIIGFLLLPIVSFDWGLPVFVSQGIETLFKPFVRSMTVHLPSWAVVTNGAVWLMLSFRIADFALPNLERNRAGSAPPETLKSTLMMFLLGLGVTLLSQSVTASFGLLVPVYARGYISARRFVPYAMGANIPAFTNTLLAAGLLSSAAAVHVVTTEIISTSFVSFILLFAGFSRYERVIGKWTDYFMQSSKQLFLFLALAFIVPLILVIL
jgi:sodium-dependent phosphate cotransporter